MLMAAIFCHSQARNVGLVLHFLLKRVPVTPRSTSRSDPRIGSALCMTHLCNSTLGASKFVHFAPTDSKLLRAIATSSVKFGIQNAVSQVIAIFGLFNFA